MITHQLRQGSPEWHEHRAKFRNASDTPVVLGCSPYKTRAQLLRERATGITPEVDAGTQRLFDSGHEFEARARPLAEEIIGESLYPVVGSNGVYSASFDGLTLLFDCAFEHKTLNAELREIMVGCAGHDLPLMYRAQMEHQCMVAGCDRVLFMASTWRGGKMVEERRCWYLPDPALRAEIVDAWDRFEADLAAYVPPEIVEPARAAPMETLPAVSVRLDGELSVVGNLPAFGAALREFVARIPMKPATDNEFATCDAACKALKRAEETLDAAEAGALASITNVEEMRRMVADCRRLARDTRLAAEKMVERRKVQIKEEAVMAARRALDAHIADLEGELAPMRLQPVVADFAGAIKGLRSIDSLRGALDAALANAKIAADAQARLIRANVAHFHKTAVGMEILFADLSALVHKAPDDFAAVLDARIARHLAMEAEKEAARQAAEAQRIAVAEQRAREQEAARIAEASRRQAEREMVSRMAEHAATGSGLPVSTVIVPSPTTTPEHVLRVIAQPRADEPATLKLGEICERLGFTVSAAFLADALHIKPASTSGRSVLYRESQWPVICRQLQAHVGAMAELHAKSEEVST